MTFNIDSFNILDPEEAIRLIRKSCASRQWAKSLVDQRPFSDIQAMLKAAHSIWIELDESDYLEAFEAHPKIGDVDSLSKKYAETKHLASGEQSLVSEANQTIIQELASANTDYSNKFGFIFIVFATGKSAKQMLDILKSRLNNSRDEEIQNAAEEQFKITQLRLNNLFSDASIQP